MSPRHIDNFDHPITEASYMGTSGDDTFAGTGSADTFNLSQGGNDTVTGAGGNDTFTFGAQFNAFDSVDGGAGGADKVILDGDYQSPVTLAANSLKNVEILQFTNGNNYNINVDEGNLAPGQVLTIDGSRLQAPYAFGFNGSAETDGGSFNIIGGHGNDYIYTAFNAGSTIDLTRGGDDYVVLNSLADRANFGATFTSSDHVEGHGIVELNGNYAAGLHLNPTSMDGISALLLDGGHSYRITLDDAFATGAGAFIETHNPTATDHYIIDGSAETDASLVFFDGLNNDTLTGGAQSDYFNMSNGGGSDILFGNGGDDVFYFDNPGKLDPTDRVDGGAGMDLVSLQGGGALTLQANTLKNVEWISLDGGAGQTYDLVLSDGTDPAGQTLKVGMTGFGYAHIDGSAERDGNLDLFGGFSGGNDILIGGRGDDKLTGKLDADQLTGGAGADTYVYEGATDSTGVHFDTIFGFDAAADRVDVLNAVTGIDSKVGKGRLNDATFDTDLANMATASHLAAGHAVLVAPTKGDEAGHLFLVIDQNGTAGYQTGHDLVIELSSPVHMSSLDMGDFI